MAVADRAHLPIQGDLMSSNGNALGYVVGAIVGYFTGGTSYILTGAALGGAVGAALDPPKGPNLQGPRLDDLSVQTSTYGVPIPRIYGTLATFGNVFWLENDKLKEVARKKKTGGKGGGGSSVTTYSYFATFAVGLCRGPIAGVRRIWIGSKLIYDARSDDIEAIIASNQAAEGFRVYLGNDTQNPDPRMQADKGINNTPAYRGLAYIVFYDYALADHGNSLMGAQVKVEVVTQSADAWRIQKLTDINPQSEDANLKQLLWSCHVENDEIIKVFAGTWLANYAGKDLNVITKSVVGNSISINGMTSITSSTSLILGNADRSVFMQRAYGVGTPTYYLYDGTGLVNTLVSTIDHYDEQARFALSGSLCAIASSGISPGMSVFDGSTFIGTLPVGGYVYGLSIVNKKIYALIASTSAIVEIFDIDSMSKIDEWVGGPSSIAGIVDTSFYCDNESEGYILEIGNSPSTGKIYKIGPNGIQTIRTGIGINYDLNRYGFKSFINDFFIWGYAPSVNKFEVYYCGFKPSNQQIELSDIVESEMLQSGLIAAPDVDVSDLTEDVRGYRITQLGAIRSAIEPLRSAWPFDVVQAGYQIECKRRGGSSVVTIPASKLDCRAIGTDQGPQLSISREMESQLPRRLQLKYLDTTREYDTGEQSAERINVESVSTTVADLPIVFTPDEAAQKAEILLYLYWMDRRDITFKLPPEYLALEPSDIVTIVTDDASYILRIVGITYTHDGRLECRAKFHDAATYTSDATGDSGSSTGTTVGLTGPTYYELLDIPTVIEDQNVPSFVAVASGVTSGWPGGIIFRSADNGQTWEDLQAFDGECTFGYARNALNPAPPSFIDARNVLTVDMINGDLESITELAMLNGGNLFAYGVNGRWEIISARTVTLNADGSYSLRDMLRGRYGTEWAAGLHVSGDVLVLLNDTDNALVGADSAQIGLPRLYRGITAGRSIDSDSNRQFTYNAVNLEPLSPVYVRGNRHPVTSDWSLFWIRRTRIGGEWRNLVDASLGESTEAYEIDILNGSGQVVRTLTATNPTVQYTSAQQTADFGAIVTNVEGIIYQVSSIVGRGYGAAFDIGLADADPYFSNVVLLMHFDGANNGTSFPDVTGKTATRFGDVITSTAQFKYGTASAYFDGANDRLSFADNSGFDFGTGNFTIDFWWRPTAADFGIIVEHANSPASGVAGIFIQYNASGTIMSGQAFGATILTSSTTIPLNTWVFVSVQRSGSNWTMYFDGIVVATGTSAANLTASGPLTIGGTSRSSADTPTGYIDDLRITKGVARYTGPFTPPTEPFKDY